MEDRSIRFSGIKSSNPALTLCSFLWAEKMWNC